jgi:hypothetical protein
MPAARISLRCYTEDLGLPLPSLDEELDAEHPIVAELKRRAPSAPQGLKRILAITSPLVYRLQRSRYRGAAWLDGAGDVFWLLACAAREEGSRDDPYRLFVRLHESGRLLPVHDDLARLHLESATRLLRAIREEIPRLVQFARGRPRESVSMHLAEDIPVRIVFVPGSDVDELWVAVSTVKISGEGVASRVRDMIFAVVEEVTGQGEWDMTAEWPDGQVEWCEVARYGLTSAGPRSGSGTVSADTP